MISHHCRGRWVDGPVSSCPHHPRPGRALNLSPFAGRHNITTEGIAGTGQISDKGTVAHREWWDGRVDGKANPRSVSAKLSEMRRSR